MSKVTFSILDYSNEVSTVGFYLGTISSANYDSVVNDGPGGAVGDIRLAMNGIISGNHLRRTVNAETFNDAAVLPTDPYSQRELKGYFEYRDTVTGEVGSFEVPTIDLDVVGQQGTDVIDLEEIAVAAFVTAVEANAVSRDGNAIEITSARVVGRSI